MMNKNDDYYKILGISRNANDSEIKKAYYRLAKEFHPDRAPDNKKDEYTERFQKIGEAYEVLSDIDKKRIYDVSGKEGLQNNGSSHFNPFQGFNFHVHKQSNHNKNRKRKNTESVFHINISLKDAYSGITKKLKITKNIIVNKITKEKVTINNFNNTWSNCYACKGQGVNIQIIQQGNMIQQFQKTCNRCSGNGILLSDEYIMTETNEILELDIPKGVKNNKKFKFHNHGNWAPGVLPGDIIIVLNVNDRFENFKRSDNDLIYKHQILLSEALCGSQFKIKTMDDRILFIEFSGIIKPDDKKIIKGEGMTNTDNLIINFDIVFPTEIFTDEEKNDLLKILPKPNKQISVDDNDIKYSI